MNEHKDIDQTIRDKMTQLTPPMKRGSWDVLADKLDAADKAAAFDREVVGKLEGIHVPYRQSSWAVLAARLELQRQRIRAVLHYKAMEISLLLLLLMTAWPYLPQGIPVAPLPPGIPVADLRYQPAMNHEGTAPTQAGTRNTYNAPTSTTIDGDLKETNDAQDNTNRTSDEPIAATSRLRNQRPANTPLRTLDGSPTPQEQLREVIAKKADQVATPSDRYPSQGPLAALNGGATVLLQYDETEDLLAYLRPSERQTFVRIGFVGGPEYNRVITPTQEIVDGVEVFLDRYSLGYGGGITIGVEHGKWEIETGLLYAARRYQAVPALYISGNITDGYSGISLRNFELNTVNIPLHFRYNFFLHNKWRLYAQGGASLNLITGANYYIANEDSFNDSDIGRNLDNENGVSRAEKALLLQSKSLIPGIFEDGGSLQENATLYGDAALGIERYMTPTWSLFVQPTYRHAIQIFNDGVGPYRDRIHNFSLGIGVKVRL